MDDSSKGEQQASASSSDLNTNQQYNWTETELDQLVDDGTFRKEEDASEHIALHPFWMGNPLTGAKEDLTSNLGKWRPSMNGYLVAYKNAHFLKRQTSRCTQQQIAFIHQDQPWLHLDVAATFYLYTPSVGQQLTGTIKKFGVKAVVCVLFNCFSATVFPQNNEEFQNWNLGDEIPFKIESFQNRRKGPLIQGKSLSSSSASGRSGIEEEFEDWELGDEVGLENVPEESALTQTTVIDFDEDDSEQPSRKKKRKKSKHSLDVKDWELGDDEVGSENVPEESALTQTTVIDFDEDDSKQPSRKRKKKKSKHSLDVNEIIDSDQVPFKQKKNKHRIKQER